MQDDRSLIELADVIRRALWSRTRDNDLIEDITQETLLRVAVLRPQLNPDVQRAYAIVTARNGFLNHCRRQDTARRHAHRVVEFTRLDGPEEVTLERAETDALAVALDALDPADSQLLLDHEVGDRELSALADELHTSSGAVAMRLGRARAALRVEFVLAFRRVTLPTDRCRPVLLAMSAGDGRRQTALDVPGHLLECATCASLLEPVAQRRRGAAAWLFFPLGAAGRALLRAGRALRHNAKVQVAVAGLVALTVAGVIAATAASSGRGTSTAAAAEATTASAALAASPSSSPATSPASAVGTAIAAPPPVPSTTPTTTSAPAATPVATPAATATDGCAPVPPISLSPTDNGCDYVFSGLTVTAVPANEGFWVTAPDGGPLWVQLVGSGESPEQIKVGQTVTVHATLRSVGPGSPAAFPADDLGRLKQRGVYLAVAYADLAVDAP